MKIKLEGSEEVSKQFKRLREAAPQKALKVLREAAFAVEAKAKRKAPKDTGRLQSSIGSAVNTKKIEAYVGTNLKYAPYQEFGTKPHFVPAKYMKSWLKRHGFPENTGGIIVSGKAQPFLRPAWKESKDFILRIIKEGLRKILE